MKIFQTENPMTAHISSFPIDFRKIELDRAEPIVKSALRSSGIRTLLLAHVYEAAGDKAPLLSERGVRDALDLLLGPDDEKTGGSERFSDLAPASNSQISASLAKKVESGPAPVMRKRKVARAPRASETASRMTRTLLKGVTDPDLYALVTPGGAAVGRIDRETGQMTLLKGAELNVSGTLAYPGMKESIDLIRHMPGAAYEDGGKLVLNTPIEVATYRFARFLIAGHNGVTQKWTDYKGDPIPENVGLTGSNRFPDGSAVRLPRQAEPEAE
jgi:hypothetical protein